jgi:PEP-CTERM motif
MTPKGLAFHIAANIRACRSLRGSMLQFKASKRAILAAGSLPGSATAALIAILGFVSPASATIVQVTYWGTVSSGSDQTGIFGPAGGSLDGDSYVAHYVFDTTQGYTYASPTNNYAYGGSTYENNSPLVSSSVTINGHTANIGGNYEGLIWGLADSAGPAESQQYEYVEYYSESTNTNTYTHDYNYNVIYNDINTVPSSIIGPFTYHVAAGDTAYGLVSVYTYNYNTNSSDLDTYAELSPAGMTVGPAIPEPSTWAMMLLGFAGLGYAGYRRAKAGHATLVA